MGKADPENYQVASLFSLKGKSIVRVYKAKSSVTLIHPQGQDFFASCRNKLGWSTNP